MSKRSRCGAVRICLDRGEPSAGIVRAHGPVRVVRPFVFFKLAMASELWAFLSRPFPRADFESSSSATHPFLCNSFFLCFTPLLIVGLDCHLPVGQWNSCLDRDAPLLHLDKLFPFLERRDKLPFHDCSSKGGLDGQSKAMYLPPPDLIQKEYVLTSKHAPMTRWTHF